MARCTHVEWLDLAQSNAQWTLTDLDRLRCLADDLPHAEEQCPSLLFFVGKHMKSMVLQDAYTDNDVTRRKVHGVANLLVDFATTTSPYPVYLADCTPGAPCTGLQNLWHMCHESHRHTMGPDPLSSDAAVASIHVNLVLPFTHVVCIFADDLGGNEACARYIQGWLAQRRGSEGDSTRLHPHLLVTTTSPDDLDILVQVECHQRFSAVFESFHILTLDGTATLNHEAFAPTLQRMIHDARQLWRERHLLLSAVDLAEAFTHAAESFSQDPGRPIDILKSSRHPAQSLSIPGIVVHLRRLLSLVRETVPVSAAAELVASALLAQGYPPGFAPELVFQQYFLAVLEATVTLDAPRDPTPLLVLTTDVIWTRFMSLFGRLGRGTTAQTLRRKILLKHRLAGERIKTTSTCLLCLMSPPERAFQCGHTICEDCLHTYYAPGPGVYTYVIDRCLVCGFSMATTLRVKAPTVMPSLLGFDGGGVRGIVALILAKRLQVSLDVPYPFWQFFHSVVGTSVGGVIVLDWIVGGSTIDDSVARFQQWVTEIFPVRSYRCLPRCQRLRDFLIWLIRDSKYDSRVLDAVMQEAFGQDQQLFDTTTQHQLGVKLGIMATTASKSQLRIFTNYNGPGRRPHDTGYEILRPTQASAEPSVWEVARVTVAAPGYFRPKQIGEFGLLQDGGLRANNPVEAGLWELGAIWPGHARPGLVVSVGTGYHNSPAHQLGQKQGVWSNRFMPRTLRAFLSSPCLHGQNSWKALLNRVDESRRDDFLRLNLEFDKEEPALDDAAQIPALCETAMNCELDLRPYRDAIWASAFIYELVRPPRLFCGYYVCTGVIFCAFPDVRPLLQAIERVYPRASIMLHEKVVSTFGTADQYCSRCGFFQQKLEFEVRHLTATVNLTLAFDRSSRRHLSSFPSTMEWIMDRQKKHGRLESWATVARCACRGPVRKRVASWTARRDSKRRKI